MKSNRSGTRPLFRPMHREGDTIRIEGIPQAFQVIDQDAAEQAEFVVCMRLAGNERNRGLVAETVLGFCSRCKEPVYWSVTAPKTPPRLCLVCLEAQQGHRLGQGEPTELPIGGVTEAVLAESERAKKIVQSRVDAASRTLATLLTMPTDEKKVN